MSPVVFCDVDGTLRNGKTNAVSGKIKEAASRFIQEGGKHFLITGAPAGHLPQGWERWASGAYTESGGVLLLPTGKILVRDEQARQAVAQLRGELGIVVDDGWTRLPQFGSVIVEGGRKASLTLLTGNPPHYPGAMGDADLEAIEPFVSRHGLQAIHGKDTVYRWLDCVRGGKELTVQEDLDSGERVYYLGDGENDLAAMELPGVIPVGFSNSIQEIQTLAKRQGVYIDLLAYGGGVAEFFRRLNSGQL
jgi:hydroxymethylpyrimidine pyrophosphatase-like HAD family hydrolase